MNQRIVIHYSALFVALGILAVSVFCTIRKIAESESRAVPEPDHVLTGDQSHEFFSRKNPPVLTVQPGAVIEAYTKEHLVELDAIKSDPESADELENFPFIFTGPVYVEGAEPGDILAITIHDIEINDFGWTALIPGFGLLADEFPEPYLKTFDIDKNSKTAQFNEKISIPLRPFLGVMGVAPDRDDLQSAIEPREFGGNMDNPYYTVGTTVYLPVYVEGALFSLGDAHAAQGMGEICGTALETAVRVVYEVHVIKGKNPISEPHYETDEFYAVGAHATTLGEAVKKVSGYMIEYLMAEHDLSREDAYMLCSIAGNLNITEVVDMPHVWVAMHMPKKVFGI